MTNKKTRSPPPEDDLGFLVLEDSVPKHLRGKGRRDESMEMKESKGSLTVKFFLILTG